MGRDISVQAGEVIRYLHHQRGLSQEELAELCGVHRTYIGMIKRAEKTITIQTALRIANGLGVSLSELFELIEDRESGNR